MVGMTVIGALVATYVRLSAALEITAGDAVVKLQADVIDKLMPAFTVGLHPDHVLVGTPRLVPLRLIAVTVVIGIVGKFCHFL
ncbi:PTS system mannose/fructose/sorbose family transporter subunit IID [Escherichia coli]